MTELQECREYIKWKYPVGTVIEDETRSVPYTIKKNSVFNIYFDSAEDYNDMFRPTEDKEYKVYFYVRNAGTGIEYKLEEKEKQYILKKYISETPVWLKTNDEFNQYYKTKEELDLFDKRYKIEIEIVYYLKNKPIYKVTDDDRQYLKELGYYLKSRFNDYHIKRYDQLTELLISDNYQVVADLIKGKANELFLKELELDRAMIGEFKFIKII